MYLIRQQRQHTKALPQGQHQQEHDQQQHERLLKNNLKMCLVNVVASDYKYEGIVRMGRK